MSGLAISGWPSVDVAAARLMDGVFRQPILRRLSRSAVWSVLGSATYQGTTLIAYIFAARMIGTERFGFLAAVQSTLAMFSVASGLGLGITCTRYVAKYRDSEPARVGAIISLTTLATLGLAAVTFLCFYGLAPALATGSLHNAGMVGALRAAAALLLLTSLLVHCQNILAGFEAYSDIAGVNFVRSIFLVPAVVLGARRAGVEGVITGMTLATLLGCLYAGARVIRTLSRSGVNLLRAKPWQEHPALVSFSLPAFLIASIAWPTMWLVLTNLGAQRGGYAQVGLLSAALQWRTAIVALPTLIFEPALPIMSNLLGKGETAECKRLLKLTLMISMTLTAVFCAVAALSSRFVLMAYGREFMAGRSVFVLLTLSSLFMVPSALIAQWVASCDRMWSSFGIHLVWSFLSLAIAFSLAPARGAAGVAVAYVIASGVQALLFMVLAHRTLFRA